MRLCLLYLIVAQCVLLAGATAQDGQSTAENASNPCSGGLTTIEQCLTEHHIALTKDGLVLAVHSENPEIWALAADELAIKGVSDAIPVLAELLEAKSDPNDKIILANALSALHDERGVETLQHYCDDRTVSMGDRLWAAYQLLRYRPKSCAATLIEGLRNDTFRVQALGMIPNFRELTPSESAQVRILLLSSLQDNDFTVRLQAAQTIRALGDATLVPPLEVAMAHESNSSVREAMGYSIETIQKKNQSGEAPK